MAPRKRKTEVTTEVTQNESSTQRVTRSSTRRVTRSSTRGASGVKLVQPQPEVPARKKAKGAPKKKQTKKEKEKVEDEAEEEAAKEEEKTEESGEEAGDENDEEKEEGEGEEEEEEGTENADDEESNKKTIVIEHCKQCTSFKTRANKVKDGLEKGVPGITVLLNPDKPRKGCFEIREEGGETYISLLDMKRPFPAMKELNMEEVINDIIEKIK